jgi:repressor LexA
MGRRPTSNLTPAHSRILKAVASAAADKGHASVAELVEYLGLARDTSLTATLNIIERNGFIRIEGGGQRGRRKAILLTARGKAVLGLGGLRVLGSIPAGRLTEILDSSETIVDYAELLPHKPGDFLLVVHGDSMIGDGILPNDKVLLRPNVELRTGEIAAVHVGDDYAATLKHVYFDGDKRTVRLQASNANYTDIVVPSENVRIVGAFRGLIRTR